MSFKSLEMMMLMDGPVEGWGLVKRTDVCCNQCSILKPVIGGMINMWRWGALEQEEAALQNPNRINPLWVSSAQCTVHTAQCTLHSAHCTVYNSLWVSSLCAVYLALQMQMQIQIQMQCNSLQNVCNALFEALHCSIERLVNISVHNSEKCAH